MKEEEYAKLLESSVFILDGFDELCTIDKIADCDKTLSEFSRLLMGSRLSVKVIITSRPNYINKLENGWKRLTLTAFDELQREEWLANYTNKCKQTIAPHITSYIHSLSERRNAIFDTPLTLYMVVAKQLEKNALENNWLLYHSIFYEKTRDTEYNRMTESSLFSDPSHPSREYWDIYYQINEEIAYRMYQTDNSCLYVDFNEIKEIIQELSAKCDELMEANIQSIVQRCHALCGFWKIRTDDGYLEFYHNDIRDFFLCEKFYRTINALYHSKEWDKEKNAVKLVELFQYADVQPKVFEFVKQRSWCGKEHLDYFCKSDFQLLNNWYFPAIFQDLMTNGMLFLHATTRGKGQEGIWSKNPVKGFATATFSILNFYNVVLVPVWDKMKYIELWPYNHPMKVSGMFLSLLTLNDWFLFLEKMDLSGMFMRNMCFDNSNLRFANLSGAKLNHSSFQYADLRYVDLQNADLENANLERANLSYANLTNAFLKDTILPDGYYCRSQDEAVAYMKALNIEGLII